MPHTLTAAGKYLLPLIALLLLPACVSAGGGEWQDVSYSASKIPVGVMGPSGSIGP